MTTRQHLIEQECMDKLGWDIARVATATDREMMDALKAHKKTMVRKQKTPDPINTSPFPTMSMKQVVPMMSTDSSMMTSTSTCSSLSTMSNNNNNNDDVLHNNTTTNTLDDMNGSKIQSLKRQIEKKITFMSSTDISNDDIQFIRSSTETDKATLESLLQSMRNDILDKEALLRKKQKTVEFLMSFRNSGTSNKDDEKHIVLVQNQIREIITNIEECRRLLM